VVLVLLRADPFFRILLFYTTCFSCIPFLQFMVLFILIVFLSTLCFKCLDPHIKLIALIFWNGADHTFLGPSIFVLNFCECFLCLNHVTIYEKKSHVCSIFTFLVLLFPIYVLGERHGITTLCFTHQIFKYSIPVETMPLVLSVAFASHTIIETNKHLSFFFIWLHTFCPFTLKVWGACMILVQSLFLFLFFFYSLSRSMVHGHMMIGCEWFWWGFSFGCSPLF